MRKKVSIADPVQLDETLDQQNYTRSCLGRGVGVMQGMHVANLVPRVLSYSRRGPWERGCACPLTE